MSQNEVDFDFKKPLENKTDISAFLQQTQAQTRARIGITTPKSTGKAWVLVGVLLLSLISLGTFTLFQIRENSRLLSQTQSAVAGVSDANPINIVNGDTFSILLKESTPKEFVLSKELLDSPYLENTASKVTFLAQPEKSGQSLDSGIEVLSTEYDNKLTNEDFEKLVLEKLGSDYEISSREVLIPKDISVTKIEDKSQDSSMAYYVTVTSENYYVIKVYRLASKYAEFSQITRFTDTLLAGLYLN